MGSGASTGSRTSRKAGACEIRTACTAYAFRNGWRRLLTGTAAVYAVGSWPCVQSELRTRTFGVDVQKILRVTSCEERQEKEWLVARHEEEMRKARLVGSPSQGKPGRRKNCVRSWWCCMSFCMAMGSHPRSRRPNDANDTVAAKVKPRAKSSRTRPGHWPGPLKVFGFELQVYAHGKTLKILQKRSPAFRARCRAVAGMFWACVLLAKDR